MTRFVIVSFGNEYIRFKKALVNSIRENMPKSEIVDIELPALRISDLQRANYIKLKEWTKHIKGNTVLIDADTILLGDISEVFDMPHDLIYTKRLSNPKISLNSGVVFVKESGIPIIKKWAEIDDKLYRNRSLLRMWQRKYFGFNQASFGYMLDTYPDLNIGHVCTSLYNSCDPHDWINNYGLAKIVHVKSSLRNSLKRCMIKYPEIEERIKKYYIGL
jgi:alpha-N-acetylglucosamine transferase